MYMKKRNLAAAVLASVIAASAPLTGAVNGGLSVTAEAAAIGSEAFMFTDNGDGTATLALYNGSDATVVIPGEDDKGNTVTAIGEEAFAQCGDITSVTIPDSVTSIGESAFYLCNSLESVNLPEGLTSIGAYAFASCFSLKNITFPESLTMIGPQAFFRCALESVTIPANTSMVANSFNVCESLTSFEVHPDNEYFSSQDGVLFSKDKTGLVQYPAAKSNTTYAVPEGVTRIYADAFYGAALLENITLPDSLNFIGSAAFYNCTSLKSITIPASVSSLDTFAFDGCSSLAAINVD